MARIHNQQKLEESIYKCDSLAGGVIERTHRIKTQKTTLMYQNKEVHDQVTDFVFGKTNENPLAHLQDAIDDQENEYLRICDTMTQETLESRSHK